MSTKMNVPQLRFREFSGEWQKSELNDLIEQSSKKFNPKINNENKKCIELEHLSQGTGELLGFTYSKEQESTKNVFAVNQVLFGKLRPYLKKFLKTDFDGVCSSEIWVLNGKKVINNYLFQLVQTNKFNQIANISSGSKMPRSDWKYMAEIPFSFPSKPEQQKIASFLSSVDSKIEQLSKKKRLLEAYKKGVMQKIFSQEIRFKKDDGSEYGEWVERKLGEFIITYRLGGNYTNTEVKSNHPLIKMGNINRGKININKLEYIKKGEPVEQIDRIKYGDLFFNTRNTLDLVGKVSIWLNELPEAYYNSNLMSIKFENNFFMNYRLNSYDGIKSLRSIATGTTSVAAIYTKDLLKIKLSLPSLNEQDKIANFLTSIDTKIAQVNTQLNATKQFKKALLQKMFV